jgi:hypothetical protein
MAAMMAPCSIKAKGSVRLPPCPGFSLEVAICALKVSAARGIEASRSSFTLSDRVYHRVSTPNIFFCFNASKIAAKKTMKETGEIIQFRKVADTVLCHQEGKEGIDR